jgi:hypothetical protein
MLRSAIDSLDIDGADDLMSQLDTYCFEEACEPFVDELRLYVAEFAIEDVLETVDKLTAYIQRQ